MTTPLLPQLHERHAAMTGGLTETPRTIDFRTGNNGWGHALHSSTWRSVPLPKRKWWDFKGRKRDQEDNVRRFSFMCHVGGWVDCGMKVLWSSADGPDREGTIVEIKPCWDPRDMYTLTVEMRGPQ